MNMRQNNVSDIYEKRNRLKELSKSLIAARDAGQYMGNEDDTVNGLLRFYYACKGYKNLKTFHEWKRAGYSIRKGEKALLVWGRPLSSKEKEVEVEQDKQAIEKEQTNGNYFPICYLFAECQVEKRR